MRVRRGFAFLMLAVVAAGCSGGGSTPRVLPSVSVVSSASPTGSPTPVVQAKTKAGLIAFVRSYYAAINEASRTHDTTHLASLSDRHCKCRRLVRYLNGVFRRGGSVRGFTYEVHRVYDSVITGATGAATAVFDIPRAQELDSRGAVVYTEPAVRNETNVVSATWTGRLWRVTAVTELRSR